MWNWLPTGMYYTRATDLSLTVMHPITEGFNLKTVERTICYIQTFLISLFTPNNMDCPIIFPALLFKSIYTT